MGTVNRVIQSKEDRVMAARFVEARDFPFTITITDGKPRSRAQNRLLHKWMGEIAEQKGDCSADEARAYCKLTIGVPILRQQNAAFKERYDEILKPLSYEQKLAIMSEPLNLPVTSLMSTKQLTEYLEAIIRHFGEQGIILTMPDDMKSNSGNDPQPEAEGAALSSPQETADDIPSSSAVSTLTQSEVRQHLMDFARKALVTAGDHSLPYPKRLQLVEFMQANYRDVLPDTEWGKLSTIMVGVQAVLSGKRTIEQARRFFAVDLLDCSAPDLGGSDENR